MVVLLVVLVAAYPVMRGYARRVEHSDAPDPDKMHRLRRAGIVFGLGWSACLVLAVAELLLFERSLLPDVRHTPSGPFLVGLGVVVGLAVLIAPGVIATLATRASIERIQGTEGQTRHVKRRLLRTLSLLLVPQVLWFATYFVLLLNHVSPLVLILVMIGYVLFLTTVSPLLLLAAIPTHAPDEDTRRLVDDLCEKQGVTIRAVRVIDTSNRPTTNALFAGFGIGPKYIFLTDRLVDSFTADETRAVLAHEIGHRKKHHVALKLLSRQGVVLLPIAIGAAVMTSASHHTVPMPVALVVVLLLLPVLIAGPFLGPGLVGIRLERAADDYAVEAVGAEPLRSALEKMTQQNLIKRRTSRSWNLMTQHPGMEERISWLRSLEKGSEPSVAAERR